ncbi:MAG: ATP-dependent helicase [Paludibacteraceae bacterium]|nr:ATP-dependent helicase [Paludibacteraceae bacterium]
MMKEDILKSLNEQQIEAVKATEGKVRVVAGAGSGKTRVLTSRYAYLVERLGIDPANILCMTFTNKAAQEMKTRIRKMVDLGAVNDYVCTIHGLCVKILRKEIYRMGYPQNFIIIDDDDRKTLMKQVMEELNLTKKDFTVAQLLDNVDMEKGRQMYLDLMMPSVDIPQDNPNATFYRFLQLQKQSFLLDFNDLIFFTLYLFKTIPEVKAYWQNEFDYIQVDEVQDCSKSDWEIIDTLSEKNGNLFIVGDPDQSIYEWRGAKPDLFVGFKADTDIILDLNYRSTPNILDVANSVIKNNVCRVEKELKTTIPSDTIVIHKHAKNEEEEGAWITKQIKHYLDNGREPNDFAILYRSTAQSRSVEQALMRQRLPYTIWGGVRFFDRKEIKDCIAYLRLVEYGDDLSFKRVVNVPSRKFGKAKLEALEQIAKSEGTTLFKALQNHQDEKPFKSEPIKGFLTTLAVASAQKNNVSIADLLTMVLDKTGLDQLYREDTDEVRVDNINELIGSIRYYEQTNINEDVRLDTYLQDIALFTNSDYKKDQKTIKLMTIHQSKGLEFPYVFVTGLTEGIFPSHRSIRDRKAEGLEEERRLMYVAITRAEKALYLTESEGYNYSTKSEKYPSRFLSEISKDLIKVEGHIDPALLLERDILVNQLNAEISEDEMPFVEGDMVKHEVFGEGVVLSVNEERKSCEVDFGNKTRNIQWQFLTAW